MPSNKRQRELARRRAERQAVRRVQRRRERRRRAVLVSFGSAVAIAGIVAAIIFLPDVFKTAKVSSSATPTPSASASNDITKVACGAKKPPAPKIQKYGSAPKLLIDPKQTYYGTLKTSCGDIVWQMYGRYAPATVNSFAFLATKNYYDGTFCHPETAGPTLIVLQCGDPSGTGSGPGPGYTLPDENLPKVDPKINLASYKRGYVAMANTGQPHTGSTQFFMVIKPSQLPPKYTVFARIVRGMDVLDRIFALGIEGQNETITEGPPKQRVYITDFFMTLQPPR